MKFYRGAACLLAAFLAASPAWGASNLEALKEPRSAVIYIEGQKVADVIVGSKAKVTFLYVDDKLKKEMERNLQQLSSVEEWMLSDAVKARVKKMVPVIVTCEAFGHLYFAPESVSVNGEPVTRRQLFTNLDARTVGDVAPDDFVWFVIGLPKSTAAPGQKITYSVGEWKTDFTVPGR